MPLYNYECKKCGYKFELIKSLKEDVSQHDCPKCGEISRQVFHPVSWSIRNLPKDRFK
jgi:putative FmdB family regulatory protein